MCEARKVMLRMRSRNNGPPYTRTSSVRSSRLAETWNAVASGFVIRTHRYQDAFKHTPQAYQTSAAP